MLLTPTVSYEAFLAGARPAPAPRISAPVAAATASPPPAPLAPAEPSAEEITASWQRAFSLVARAPAEPHEPQPDGAGAAHQAGSSEVPQADIDESWSLAFSRAGAPAE